MSDNTRRFTGRVQEYARFRREYPATKILEWLGMECGLASTWRVADLATGTGMLSKVFLRNGNPVTAVEPNAEMRAACEELRSRWPELKVRDGTAEATGLGEGTVEMIAAGRAFHWFQPRAAATEFRRVLGPEGWVVLVSSGRKQDESERGREFEAMLLEHGTDPEYGARRRLRESGWGEFLRGLGRPETYGRVVFEEAWPLAFEEFRGMVQSVSCAPLENDARYLGMQRALEAFFTRWSRDGTLPWAEECVMEAARMG